MTQSFPPAAVLLLLLFGDDPFDEGLRLYREGKYKEALAAFSKAEAESTDAPIPQLLYDKALAAFAAGDPHEAEASAEKAAASGRSEFVRARDFLRGNIAFQRSAKLEIDADAAMNAPPPAAPTLPPDPKNPQPPAPPPPDPVAGYDKAIQHAEIARDAWVAASKNAESAPEGPAARRNVERAIVKIEDLKKKKEEAEKRKKEQQKKDKKDDKGDKNDQDKDKDKNQPESRPESRPQEPESRPEGQPSKDQNKDDKPEDQKKNNEEKKDQPKPQDPQQLTPEQVQRMLDKLDDKEKQRQAMVKKAARVLRVLRDW